ALQRGTEEDGGGVSAALSLRPAPTSRRALRKGSSRMASKGGWSRRFDEPIMLPDGRKLKTLAEANGLAGEGSSEVRAQDGEGADRSALRDAGCGARRADDLRSDGNDAGEPSPL